MEKHNMIKKYINKKGYNVTKVRCYIIEEHQAAYDRWVSIRDETYGIDKEHGEFTSCGECWQKTGIHGTFNKQHALDICKKLNNALADGSIYDCFNHRAFKDMQAGNFKKAGVTEFRVVEYIKTIKTKVIEGSNMENINSTQLSKLKKYLKTFNIKYADISRALDLDNSTIGKYFNNGTKMSLNIYLEIIQVLNDMAQGDDLKNFIIDNWLKVETVEQKKNSLKQLASKSETLSLELNDLIGD